MRLWSRRPPVLVIFRDFSAVPAERKTTLDGKIKAVFRLCDFFKALSYGTRLFVHDLRVVFFFRRVSPPSGSSEPPDGWFLPPAQPSIADRHAIAPPSSSPRAAAAAPGRPNAAVRRGVSSSKDGARAPGTWPPRRRRPYPLHNVIITIIIALLLFHTHVFYNFAPVRRPPSSCTRAVRCRPPSSVPGARHPRDKVQLVHRRLRHLDTSQPHGRPSAAVGACLPPPPRPTLRRIPPIPPSFPTRRMVPARYLPLFHYAVNNIRIRFDRFIFQTLSRSNRNLETHRFYQT